MVATGWQRHLESEWKDSFTTAAFWSPFRSQKQEAEETVVQEHAADKQDDHLHLMEKVIEAARKFKHAKLTYLRLCALKKPNVLNDNDLDIAYKNMNTAKRDLFTSVVRLDAFENRF